MVSGFASCLLLSHLLSALILVEADGTIGTNAIRLNSMDGHGDHAKHNHHHAHQNHAHAHHQSSWTSSTNQIDPQVMAFYMLHDLKVAKVMPVYFPNRDLSRSQLLPKDEADNIPFSVDELPHVLRLFSISQGSPQAIAMENTLHVCQVKPIKGETRFCATSVESMHEFTRRIFGFDTKFRTFTTTHHKKSTVGHLQNYKVVEITNNIPTQKLVACHTLPYPYAVFICHSQESENKVLMVTLEGEDGDLVEALSVCHMDTSQWSRNHVSFRVLGVEPGTTSVCHFFPSDNFVFIPLSAAM